MEYEVICDASGWCFKMPRLSNETIDKYGLGIWDLADFTFGTPYAMWLFYKHVSEFDLFDKVIWRVENWLRRLEWTLFLNNHKTLSTIVGRIRDIVFNIGWKKVVYERG